MPLRFPRSILLLALMPLAACGHAVDSTAVTVRDSAGITILEHSAAAVAAAPQWTFGPATMTIGGGAGEDQNFSFLAGATRLTDGRFVLADNDPAGARFLVYGPDGRFERRVGRNGQGPGEFGNARLLGVAGDTLVIFDFMTARVTRMSAGGALIATTDLGRLGVMKIGLPGSLLGDGRIVTSPIPFGDTTDHGSAPFRQASAVQLLDPAAGTLDTVAKIPGTEVALIAMSFGGQARRIPAPLGYGKRTLIGSDATQIHLATNEGSEVVTYRLPWAPVRIVRIARTAPPVDQPARQAQIDAAIANIQGGSEMPATAKASMIESIRSAPFADSMAQYQALVVGTDGGLWLREMHSVADSVPHMLILDPTGHLAARADLPTGARLMWTDGAQVLVALADKDDLPRVELRPVVKNAPAP